MTRDTEIRQQNAQRFRDAALPHLDDVYALACVLLSTRLEVEEAVRACYVRAQHDFPGRGGAAMKPWLLKILRTGCYATFARLGGPEATVDRSGFEMTAGPSVQLRPLSTQCGRATAIVEHLAVGMPTLLREVVALRERNGLTYREIADITGVPVGTVMLRLVRAREMLLAAWDEGDAAAQDGRHASVGHGFACARASQP